MESTIDYQQVKQVQQRMWAAGDFARIATGHQLVAENLCEAVDVLPGERVLDVACGSGNTAIAAARRVAEVTGVDYVPSLLEHGRERARAELVEVEFIEGDAEALPFEDGSFDVVLSTFGAMFAPNQQRTADEMLRVCRPGGRIGMANWTPGGAVGEIFRTVATHAPPPAPIDPPPLWGTEDRLRQLFGERISSLEATPRFYRMKAHSAEQWLEFFRTWFGPTKTAFERLDEEAGDALARDLLDLQRRNNVAGDRALVVPAEYLEVVAIRA